MMSEGFFMWPQVWQRLQGTIFADPGEAGNPRLNVRYLTWIKYYGVCKLIKIK